MPTYGSGISLYGADTYQQPPVSFPQISVSYSYNSNGAVGNNTYISAAYKLNNTMYFGGSFNTVTTFYGIGKRRKVRQTVKRAGFFSINMVTGNIDDEIVTGMVFGGILGFESIGNLLVIHGSFDGLTAPRTIPGTSPPQAYWPATWPPNINVIGWYSYASAPLQYIGTIPGIVLLDTTGEYGATDIGFAKAIKPINFQKQNTSDPLVYPDPGAHPGWARFKYLSNIHIPSPGLEPKDAWYPNIIYKAKVDANTNTIYFAGNFQLQVDGLGYGLTSCVGFKGSTFEPVNLQIYNQLLPPSPNYRLMQPTQAMDIGNTTTTSGTRTVLYLGLDNSLSRIAGSAQYLTGRSYDITDPANPTDGNWHPASTKGLTFLKFSEVTPSGETLWAMHQNTSDPYPSIPRDYAGGGSGYFNCQYQNALSSSYYVGPGPISVLLTGLAGLIPYKSTANYNTLPLHSYGINVFNDSVVSDKGIGGRNGQIVNDIYVTGNYAHVFGAFNGVMVSGTGGTFPASSMVPLRGYGGYVKIDLTTGMPVSEPINLNYRKSIGTVPGYSAFQITSYPGSVKSYYIETDPSGNALRTHLFGDIQNVNGQSTGVNGHLILDENGKLIPEAFIFTK
jgi:hypothetical protein